MRRLRMIGLIGAGAISSAAICSLYFAYTLSNPKLFRPPMPDPQGVAGVAESGSGISAGDQNQTYLVGFLEDADPQIRILAVWGLVSDQEVLSRERGILDLIRDEKDPAVRVTLYRYLHGQRVLEPESLVELVREEEGNLLAWLAGCDLLAESVQSGSDEKAREFFDSEIVPVLKRRAVGSAELSCKIAAIIILRRARTDISLRALEVIAENSADDQVVAAASSAIRLAAHQRVGD